MTHTLANIINKCRKTLMFILNAAKFLLIFGGIPSFLFFTCGIDSTGEVGEFFMTGLFLSFLSIFIGVLCEIVVVLFLLKPNEKLTTIFEFKIYEGKKVTPLGKNVSDVEELDEDEDDDCEYEFAYEDDDYEYYVSV